MFDLIFETWRSVRAHAVRFLLTSLGIAWGAFMLTFLSANMAGTDAHITRELEELGEKTVFMGGGVILKNRVGERSSRSVELEKDDLSRIASVAAVESATPNMQLWNQIVRAAGRTKVLNVLGINHRANVIRNMHADQAAPRVYKCDLCSGEPKCAMFCPTKAIEYLPIPVAAQASQKA